MAPVAPVAAARGSGAEIPTLVITKADRTNFLIHATGFRPNEPLTVKMTTYAGGVCVSNEPDPSCFWDRLANANGVYDRTTPLDVVTTRGKHWYWIEGARSGTTNRVALDLATGSVVDTPQAPAVAGAVDPAALMAGMTAATATASQLQVATEMAGIDATVQTEGTAAAVAAATEIAGLPTVQPGAGGGTLCSDGSMSPSTGRGTCSHHGGEAGGRPSSGARSHYSPKYGR